MNCEYVQDHLEDFMDNDNDGHVAECAACKKLLQGARRDRELLRGLEPLAVPDELRQRISEQLRLEIRLHKAKPPAWKFFVPRLAPVAAAIMVMVAGTNVIPALSSKDMPRNAGLDPEAPLLAPPPGIMTEGDPGFKERGDTVVPDPAPAPEDPELGVAAVVEPDDEFTVMAMPEDISDAEALVAMEGAPRPLWVKAAMGGTILMLLWSAVVFFWYRRL